MTPQPASRTMRSPLALLAAVTRTDVPWPTAPSLPVWTRPREAKTGSGLVKVVPTSPRLCQETKYKRQGARQLLATG